MNIRNRVDLSEAERAQFTALLSGGKHAACKLKRAQILLAADAGVSDEAIVNSILVGGSTVCRTIRRFVEGNFDLAMSEEARPGGKLREPIQAAPGQPGRYDCENRRNGKANLFVFFDARRSSRHVKVTGRRSAREFAVCMRDPSDIFYPDADQIRVMMDNLLTHTARGLA